jgi:hypothetical protein
MKQLMLLIMVFMFASQGYAEDVYIPFAGEVQYKNMPIVLLDKTVTREAHGMGMLSCSCEEPPCQALKCTRDYDIKTCYKIGTSDGTVIAEFCDTKPEEK